MARTNPTIHEIARLLSPEFRIGTAGRPSSVGLNESIWRKVPPPPEVVAWVAQDVGAAVQPLTADAWAGLLAAAGLTEITVHTYAINTRDEAQGIVRRYGVGGMLRILLRMLSLYAHSAAYRQFVRGVRAGGVIPDNLDEYFGYGLFVGRK